MYRERWLYMHYTYICSYACFRFCKGVPSGTHLKAPNTHVPNSCPWCDSGTVAGEWRIAWSSKCGRGTTIHGRGLHHNAYVMRSGVWLTLVRIILYRYIEKEIYILFCSRWELHVAGHLCATVKETDVSFAGSKHGVASWKDTLG